MDFLVHLSGCVTKLPQLTSVLSRAQGDVFKQCTTTTAAPAGLK